MAESVISAFVKSLLLLGVVLSLAYGDIWLNRNGMAASPLALTYSFGNQRVLAMHGHGKPCLSCH